MKNYLKTNNISVILGYLIAMVLGSFLGILIICNIAATKYGITLSEATNLLTLKDLNGLEPSMLKAYYFMQSWNNLLSYVLIFGIVVFFGRGFIVEDFINLKSENKLNLLYSICFAILGFGLLYGSSVLFSWLSSLVSNVTSSENQNSFVGMITNGYGPIVFISVVFLAPISEELVYRKSIFKFFKEKKLWYIPTLISGLVFALPHMLTTQESFLVWVIFFFSYFSSGVILALVYHFSDDNVIVSTICHMLNNLLAFLLIVL